MQPKSLDRHSDRLPANSISHQMLVASNNPLDKHQAFCFQANFIGSMDMYSDAGTVSEYLNAHEGWFCRCAQPMKVQLLGENSYVLTVGRFGAFGYEVEPKIAVVLNPPICGVYTMETIPIPNYQPPGYDVDYHAAMELTEIPTTSYFSPLELEPLIQKQPTFPSQITQVSWTLSLTVQVKFPKFIYKLSNNLIQSTGNRVLGQIIKQISPRLTHKVQQDFHARHHLPIPPKSGRKLDQVM